MSILPRAVSKVIESFQKLPGIGPKSAQRLAFYLLHVPQSDLEQFAANLIGLKKNTVLCSMCKNVSEENPCSICLNADRNQSMICVVEQPTDVLSIERTGMYKGLYHVLHGVIDPLNNIGPDEIYIDDLAKRIQKNNSGIEEIIIATNPNMEGEATALYIQKFLSGGGTIKFTRLARGLPTGGDIEYADDVTLGRAITGRSEY